MCSAVTISGPPFAERLRRWPERVPGVGRELCLVMVAASFSTSGLSGLLRADDHCSPGPLQE